MKILWAGLVILIIIAIVLLVSWGIVWCLHWGLNTVLPAFHGPHITFPQTVALYVVLVIVGNLFRSSSSSSKE